MIKMVLKSKLDCFFLFKCKVCHKAVETTHNINNGFGLGTVNELTVQWWFRKFCNGDESLEIGQPSEVDKD